MCFGGEKMGAIDILEKDVIQANPLIEARKEMNVTEMRLFLLGLQDIKPHIKDDNVHDIDFHETIITYSELKALFGKDFYGNISNLKKQLDKAYDGKIELSYEDGGFGFRHIYRKMDYKPQEGLIIQFDDELKPYILELVNQAYTRYKVKALFSLSSTYSWRILELLLQKQGYLKQGYKEVFLDLPIEKLRFELNVEKGKYEGRMNNFRKYILDNPIKEINEKTDYYVWYDVHKTGRKVTGFKLWLKLKNPHVLVTTTETEKPATTSVARSEREELVATMQAEGMTKAAINTWIKRDGLDSVKASFSLALEHANGKTETQHKGTQRKNYIKACMERNIAYTNNIEAELKAEIEEREREAAEEKKQAIKAMQEGFENIGFSTERKGSDLQSFGSLLGSDEELPEEQELTKEQLKTLLEVMREAGADSEAFKSTIKNYGYNSRTFFHKYMKYILK